MTQKSKQQPWETMCQGKNCKECHGKSCVDGPPGPATFAWSDWPMGNSLILYWNARALAVAQGRDFIAVENPPKSNLFLNILPRKVPKSEMTADQKKTVETLKTLGDQVCWACPVPHWATYAPWRILYDTMLTESQAAISKLNVETHPWASDPDTAALHIRCDDTIMSHHNDYGVLPFSFFDESLPSNVKRVVFVSKPETLKKGATVCQKYTWELKQFLEEKKKVKVEMGGVSKDSFGDWVFLAR